MNIYCGNNQLDSDLVNGNLIIGNRYQCLKKGIGKGLSLPYDEKYLLDYIPIDDRKIYCGNDNILPEGYHTFGNLPQCLQKGVGIGKKQKALEGLNVYFSPINNIFLYKKYMILIIFAFLLFFILFFVKPPVIMYKDKNNIYKINWGKFILIYSLVYIPISFFIFITV